MNVKTKRLHLNLSTNVRYALNLGYTRSLLMLDFMCPVLCELSHIPVPIEKRAQRELDVKKATLLSMELATLLTRWTYDNQIDKISIYEFLRAHSRLVILYATVSEWVAKNGERS